MEGTRPGHIIHNPEPNPNPNRKTRTRPVMDPWKYPIGFDMLVLWLSGTVRFNPKSEHKPEITEINVYVVYVMYSRHKDTSCNTRCYFQSLFLHILFTSRKTFHGEAIPLLPLLENPIKLKESLMIEYQNLQFSLSPPSAISRNRSQVRVDIIFQLSSSQYSV